MSKKRKLSILVIDDEEAIRLIMADFLQNDKYDVITAEDGKIGIEKFEKHHPDILFIDLKMPIINGLQVIEHVSKKSPETPLIVVSGACDITEAIEAVRKGAWDYILKPVLEFSVLNHSIDRAMERVKLINEKTAYQKNLEKEVKVRTSDLLKINKELIKEVESHKITSEALGESQNNLESILKTIPDIVYRLDANGKIIFISEATRRYGYDPEELIGLNILDLVHREDRDKAIYRLNDRRTGDRSTHGLEIRLFYRDHKHRTLKVVGDRVEQEPVFFVHAEGIYGQSPPTSESFLGTQGIARDITEYKQYEHKIRESEERLKLALRGADLGLWDWNLETGDIYYDKRSRLILGYDDEEFDQLRPINISILHPDDQEKVKKALNDHLAGRSPVYELEVRMLCQDGEWKWILDRGTVVQHDKNKRPLRMAGTYLDITAKKNYELETETLERQLAQAQKMESIGTLAGGVAHDFNNILTVISGHAELALLKNDLDSVKKDLSAILTSTNRATELTRQLLAFSRKQVIKAVVLDFNKVIDTLKNMLYRLIGENISIETSLTENIPNIEADAGQLEQVIMNLVINARDAINEKSAEDNNRKISISTSEIDLDEEFVSGNPGSDKGKHLLISVTDTGTGMDEEMVTKIFEPFFTTKSAEKGTGLGLSTVYGIVRQNKGFIKVESEKGKGSVFNVYWPVSRKKASKKQTEKITATKLKGKETILLVEDELNVREFACSVLKDFGYNVYPAENGEMALQIIKKIKDELDLVVTDMIMPIMSGDQLVRKIRDIKSDINVLYISGYSDEQLMEDNDSEETLSYLPKPFSVHGLLQKVKEAIAN